MYDLSLSPLRWSWTITGIAPSPSVICLAFANKGRIVLKKNWKTRIIQEPEIA